MENYYTADEHGTYYRLEEGELEYQPMTQGETEPNTEEWGAVETDLVGEEEVPFLGKTMKLKDVHAYVINKLMQ